MEEKKDNSSIGCVIIFLIPIILIIGMFIVSGIKEISETNHEIKLLEEGKTVSAKTVAEEFAKELQNNNYNTLKSYLSTDCKIIDSNNDERANLKYCFEELNKIENYTIEHRGNSLEDQETYRILCNGTKYEDTSQIITLYLRRRVKKEEITYEIYMVKFTDNTLAKY